MSEQKNKTKHNIIPDKKLKPKGLTLVHFGRREFNII